MTLMFHFVCARFTEPLVATWHRRCGRGSPRMRSLLSVAGLVTVAGRDDGVCAGVSLISRIVAVNCLDLCSVAFAFGYCNAFHTFKVPRFPVPRFPPRATWSRVFQSRLFQSRVFSVVAVCNIYNEFSLRLCGVCETRLDSLNDTIQ